jgi:hypothetical protein
MAEYPDGNQFSPYKTSSSSTSGGSVKSKHTSGRYTVKKLVLSIRNSIRQSGVEGAGPKYQSDGKLTFLLQLAPTGGFLTV